VFGAYALDNSAAGPVTLVFFSLVGWVLARYKYPPAAVVVGMLLGGLLENEALKTMQISDGHPSYMLERPAAIIIFVLMTFSLIYTILVRRKKALAQRLSSDTTVTTF
jgi:putative tricarboxylic transport membrane protein